MKRTATHAAAQGYRALGYHPIPCRPRAKVPLVKWEDWQRQAPPAELIDRWWSQWPDANVALVLGRGTLAVDLDGGPAAEALLAARGVTLPATAPRSHTGHGEHVFLMAPGAVPDRVDLLRTAGRTPEGAKRPQVDIRGVGIVVVPPSIHPDGPTYRWAVPLDQACPPAPDALLTLIREAASSPRGLVVSDGSGWVAEALAGVPEGQRDATCARLAGFLLAKGLDADVTTALLLGWGARCQPPFPAPEIRKTVRSIAAREAASPEASPTHAVAAVTLEAALDTWLEAGAPPVVPTPWPRLTQFLDGGWGRGELIYLGARPSVGKTALALEAARHAATAGHGVLVVSREMVVSALARRMVAQAARIPASALKRQRLDALQHDRLTDTLPTLKGLPVWLTDQAVSLTQIVDLVTTWSAVPLGLVIVDYLQLVRAPRDIKDRRLQVEAISQGLKQLAVTAHVPVLCLSSLSRSSGERKDGSEPRPTLDRLRESGELEHDADVVLFLHRPHGQVETELMVAKARDGHVGTVMLRFLPEYVAFDTLEEDRGA